MTLTSTEQGVEDAAKWIDRVVTPVVVAVGFPGNIISLLVWAHPDMRTPSVVYFIALTVNDLAFLLLCVLYELEVTWSYNTFSQPVLCECLPLLYTTVQMLSCLLVLLFTVERYVSVRMPIRCKVLFTPRRVKMAVASAVLVSLAINVPIGYFFTYSQSQRDCILRQNVLRGGTTSVFALYQLVSQTFTFGCLPVATLVLNCLIIRELRARSKLRSTRSQKSSTTSLVLLAVSFQQIFTSIPASVIYLVNYFYVPDYNVYIHFFNTAIIEFSITQFAARIFLYLASGSRFRENLKKRLHITREAQTPSAAFTVAARARF